MEGGRGHDRLVSWASGRQLEQQRVQLVVLQQEHERPVEREQQHRFSSRKPLQADAGPICRGPGVPSGRSVGSALCQGLLRPPVRPDFCIRLAERVGKEVGRTKRDAATAARRAMAFCGHGRLRAAVAVLWPAQFTPGSRTTLRTRPPPPPPSDREYTPARSADRHRPEAHWRRASILSAAVTATGTTFCAA